jgi:hypothetical protein
MLAVEVGDSPDAWRRAGFAVDEDGSCEIAGVDFRIVGTSGARGVLSCTIEADIPAAPQDETLVINGLTYHSRSPSGEPVPARSADHPSTVNGIQKLEICPVETWDTLTRLVHRVLPPPYNALAYKNPQGQPQNVALWRMHNMEVFEMADAMGQTEKDEMAMFFLIVSDLQAAIAAVGEANCGDVFEQSPGRKAVILSRSKLDLSVLIFLVEPAPPPVEE